MVAEDEEYSLEPTEKDIIFESSDLDKKEKSLYFKAEFYDEFQFHFVIEKWSKYYEPTERSNG